MAFKLCVIGCGPMATDWHGPSYQAYLATHPDWVLAGCCDLDGAKAETLRESCGFLRTYTDYHTMMAQENPDAVCLLVHAGAMARLAVDILRYGVPVLLEKPPGLTAEETAAIAEAARAAGTTASVAFNRRHMPLVRRLREALAAETGDITCVKYDFYRTGRTDDDFSTTAIHGIDMARVLAGADYQALRLDYRPHPALGAHVTDMYLAGTFENGAAAQLAFCPVGGVDMERAVVHLTGVTYELRLPVWGGVDMPGYLARLVDGKVDWTVTGSDEPLFITNGFFHENAAFLDAVAAGYAPQDGVESGIQPVAVAEHIRARKTVYQK